MVEGYTAEEVHSLIADIFASGTPSWPVSRKALKGLRLRQVTDAIKIHVASVYLQCLAGETPAYVYEGLKKYWPALIPMLPVAFTREELWNEFEDLPPDERSIKLLGKGAGFAVNQSAMNSEELEFNEDETFESFIAYLEIICKEHQSPFDHILGHLSRRYIYIDDTIPVLKG